MMELDITLSINDDGEATVRSKELGYEGVVEYDKKQIALRDMDAFEDAEIAHIEKLVRVWLDGLCGGGGGCIPAPETKKRWAWYRRTNRKGVSKK